MGRAGPGGGSGVVTAGMLCPAATGRCLLGPLPIHVFRRQGRCLPCFLGERLRSKVPSLTQLPLPLCPGTQRPGAHPCSPSSAPTPAAPHQLVSSPLSWEFRPQAGWTGSLCVPLLTGTCWAAGGWCRSWGAAAGGWHGDTVSCRRCLEIIYQLEIIYHLGKGLA